MSDKVVGKIVDRSHLELKKIKKNRVRILFPYELENGDYEVEWDMNSGDLSIQLPQMIVPIDAKTREVE